MRAGVVILELVDESGVWTSPSGAEVGSEFGDLVPAPHHVGTKSAPSAGRLRQRRRGGS
jgi:hypothetical protein